MKNRIAYECTSFYFPENPPDPVNPEPNPQPAPVGSKRDLLPNKERRKRQLDENEGGQDSNDVDADVCVPRRGPVGGDGRPRHPSSCSPEFLLSIRGKNSQLDDSCR